MTSEIGRMFKCLKTKPSYHCLQDDAYSHITLLQTEDVESPENDETSVKHPDELISPKSNNQFNAKNQNQVLASSSEDNRQNECCTPTFQADCQLNDHSGNLTSPNEQRLPNCNSLSISESIDVGKVVVNSNNTTTPTNGNGGGLLSFLGLKFNKSTTRHLDRSSSGDSVEKVETSLPNRYTKFPLRAGAPRNRSEDFHRKLSVTPDPSSSSSRSSVESHSQSSSSAESSSSTAPQSNSRFDISQIQLTPQTKVYSNPNRSPSRSSSRKGTFSPSTFLSKSIASFGKKGANKGSTFASRRKSKSDNNLHRVDLNSVSESSVLSILGGRSSTGGNRGGSASSQNIYSPEESELRLNSVQIGDHATIHLPWTGLQRNNLSTTTPNRVHQHTHNNNLDSVRYVECGFKWTRDQSANNFFRREITHAHLSSLSRTEYAPSWIGVRRRSKSLERDAGYRINPRDSIASSSAGTLSSTHSHSSADSYRLKNLRGKQGRDLCTTEIPPNANFGLHQIRRCLTTEEQEILLRNISWDNCFSPESEPPPRPEKPPSLRNKFISSDSSRPLPDQPASFSYKKPPVLGAIFRSAPNSFSNSSDSNDSISNYSAPPSPPPRPLSTLRPESRLISPSKSKKTQGFQGGGVVRSQSCKSPSRQSQLPPFLGPRGSKSDVEDFPSDRNPRHRKTFEGREQDHHPSSQQTLLPAATTLGLSLVSSSQKMSIDETQHSKFISKPMKGWLHSDQLLSKEGVTYNVRYIGCLDVNKSMKSLDFGTRSLIAKECINQVCEAAGLKSVDRKRKVDRNVARILGTRPRLDHAGSDVHLTITSTCLKLTSLDSGGVIANHEMPNISFASGGDATTLDFIAYVAKDPVVGRACFILECGSGLAQDVIITIGQAFELRFKECCQKRPPPPRLPTADDREYYNDLPGKVPPENVSGEENGTNEARLAAGKGKEIPTLTLPVGSEVSVNLIDFEAPTPPAFGPTTQEKHLESLLLGPDSPTFPAQTPSASANSVGTGLGLLNSPSQPKPHGSKDPFDMQPFAAELSKPLTVPEHRKLLEGQTWFHGCISRAQAESLVTKDGDFLVRESQNTAGQYVLTGIQNATPRHLLLVDASGVVRTKQQTFQNVVHLITHHSDNSLPIISAESMVLLRNPILKEPPST